MSTKTPEETIIPSRSVKAPRTLSILPRDGETVVALLKDGEATLKRFYRTPHGIRLEAANPAYKPILTNDVEIQGVVAGVLRRY